MEWFWSIFSALEVWIDAIREQPKYRDWVVDIYLEESKIRTREHSRVLKNF